MKASALGGGIPSGLKSKHLILEKFYRDIPVYAYDSPEAFYAGHIQSGFAGFCTGMGHAPLRRTTDAGRNPERGPPALFPASLLEQLEIEVGETVQIADRSNCPYTCIIVGQYSGWKGDHRDFHPKQHDIHSQYLIPLSVLEAMEGD